MQAGERRATAEEVEVITAQARAVGLSVGAYLRAVGAGYQPRSVVDRAGGSFRGLVTYLTSARGKTERLGRVRLTNCVSSDVVSTVLEVESAQARNRRARHGVYHLILAFPAGEEPHVDVLEAIERSACEGLRSTSA